MYQTVVALAVAMHFTFLCYIAVGGFLALRWRHTVWLHVLAVLWGIASVVGHVGCPLTGLERWARSRAGMQALPPEGFIAHYIIGRLYPASWMEAVQLAAFTMVVASWVLYIWLHIFRGRHREVQGADRGASGGVR